MRALLLFACLSSPLMAETYGSFQDKSAQAQTVEKALAQYKDGTEKPVHVEGTVKQVCEKEGCWMTLSGKAQTVRVIFKDHSFFVGKALVGKKVVAEGVLFKKVQTVAQQKHYLEDAGASKGEIDAITQPKESYQLVATAVKTI